MIDSEPHLIRMCNTSLLFAPLAVRVHTGCSAFPLYTPIKPLIRLHIKDKTVFFLNYKFFLLYIFNKNVNISNKFNFWNVHGISCKVSEPFMIP